jgi:uncharacterized protein YjbJ (UPF0337 family)
LCWLFSWSQAEGLFSEDADCTLAFNSTYGHISVLQDQSTEGLQGGEMNKDTVKGTVDDVAGRTKRQIGEWTGDTNAQIEGTAQQLKGKTEKVVGNVKDAARDFRADVERDREKAKEREAESTHAGVGRG